MRRLPGCARVAQLSGRDKETPRLGSSYTRSVTAEDPTLRWRDLFAFFVSGSYVKFEMEGGVNAGIYEDFPGFRYLEISGHTRANGARDRQWVVDLDPLRRCHFVLSVEVRTRRERGLLPGAGRADSRTPRVHVRPPHAGLHASLTPRSRTKSLQARRAVRCS